MRVRVQAERPHGLFGLSGVDVAITTLFVALDVWWPRLCEEDLGFGFDDEEGVGIGVAGVAELLEGVV